MSDKSPLTPAGASQNLSSPAQVPDALPAGDAAPTAAPAVTAPGTELVCVGAETTKDEEMKPPNASAGEPAEQHPGSGEEGRTPSQGAPGRQAWEQGGLSGQDTATLAQSYSSAKEKNRKAQQRFRERRKSLVDSLKQRVDSLTSQIAASDKQLSALRAENESLRNECAKLKEAQSSVPAEWVVNLGRPITLPCSRPGFGDGGFQNLDASQLRFNTLNSPMNPASQSMLLTSMESQLGQQGQPKIMLTGPQGQSQGGLFLPFHNNFQGGALFNAGSQGQIQMQAQPMQGDQLNKDSLLLGTMCGSDNSRGALLGQTPMMSMGMNLDQVQGMPLQQGSPSPWNGMILQVMNRQAPSS